MNPWQDSTFHEHIKSYPNRRNTSSSTQIAPVYGVAVTYSASCNNKHTMFVGVQSQTDKIEYIIN